MKKGFLILLFFVIYGNCKAQNNYIALIAPYNKDTINNTHPVFSWSYLKTYVPRGPKVTYSFTLVMLKKNQSAQAGISVNTPLVKIESIQGFQFAYPFDAPKLTYNNRYGWQIQKKVNGIVVSSSEAWEFILYKKVIIPMKYVSLSSVPNSAIYEANKKGFFFRLPIRYHQTNPLKIVVLNDELMPMRVQMEQDKKMGLKKQLVPTAKGYYFLKTISYPPGIYTLKVIDIKRNVYTTLFKIK